MITDHSNRIIRKRLPDESVWNQEWEQYDDTVELKKKKDALDAAETARKAHEARQAQVVRDTQAVLGMDGAADSGLSSSISAVAKTSGPPPKRTTNGEHTAGSPKKKRKLACGCFSDVKTKLEELGDSKRKFTSIRTYNFLGELYETNTRTCQKHTTELANILGLVIDKMDYRVIKKKLYLICKYHQKGIFFDDMKSKAFLYGFFVGQKTYTFDKSFNIDRARFYASSINRRFISRG